jgi:hypothetical protein
MNRHRPPQCGSVRSKTTVREPIKQEPVLSLEACSEINPLNEYAGPSGGRYNCTEFCKSVTEPWGW